MLPESYPTVIANDPAELENIRAGLKALRKNADPKKLVGCTLQLDEEYVAPPQPVDYEKRRDDHLACECELLVRRFAQGGGTFGAVDD